MDKTLGNNKTAKLKKNRKRRHSEARTKVPTPKEQSNSIITKHRITRNLGIYNKAKKSDTILRESNEPKVTKKNCQDFEQQMKKDLSKVLDVSSFRINSLGASAESQKYNNLTSNILDSYKPSERNSPNSPHESVTSSLCGSSGDLYQGYSTGSSKGLAFKTPLQEISENLTDSLHPASTFNGRNYFSEVKEQILKIFKQSSANQVIEKHEIHSALHKRLHIRKTGKPALKCDTPKPLSNNTSLTTQNPILKNNINSREQKPNIEEYIGHQPRHEDYKQYKPNISNKMENSSSNVELYKQTHFSTNPMINQTYDRRENLSCKNMELFHLNSGENGHDGTYSKPTSTFDILDFLDHTVQKTANQNAKYFPKHNDKELECLIPVLDKSLMKPVEGSLVFDNTIKKPTTENLKFFPHQKDEDIELFEKSFPEVSPLKKPSLKTPTPPRFYRRKMF